MNEESEKKEHPLFIRRSNAWCWVKGSAQTVLHIDGVKIKQILKFS